MTLNELGQYVAEEFAKSYGRQPTWIAAAPGRVNIIGEHTDYNDGFVFPMAIDRYNIIAAAPSADGKKKAQIRCTNGDGPVTIDLTKAFKPAAKGTWYNYPLGVFAGFKARKAKFQGFDALVHTTVPLGGGLSSSAAFEVATATLLEAITGTKLDPVEKALVSQKAEHDFAGVPCGIMDQFISVMGKENHLLLLDCRTCKTELVPLTDPSLAVLIVNTNVKHALTGGGYAKRREQCEEAAKILGIKALRDADAAMLEANKSKLDPVVYRRARHVIGEIERTTSAAEGIRASNWPTVGQLMYASHYSLKDDYEVSCPELDAVVEIAESIGANGGVIGCRMTGGGFGGCAVALVKTDKVDAISKHIAAEYEKRTKIKPTLFVSRPAPGATLLKG